MSAKRIVRRIPGRRGRGKTDWTRVGAISDREIESAVKADADAAPPGAEFNAEAIEISPMLSIRRAAVRL